MEKKGFIDIIKANNIKIRSITNMVAIALMFIAGLFFVLFIDLKAKVKEGNISTWLFLSIIFALGGGIMYFAGDSLKHKKVATLILKGVGIALSIGFVAFTFVFNSHIAEMIKADEVINQAKTISTISMVIAIIGIVVMVLNYVFSILFLDEEY